MSLRSKIIFLILTINLLLLAILYGVFAQNWFQTIINFEQSAIKRDFSRIDNTLQRELDTLSATVFDCSAWDDTYQFVQDQNQRYVTSTLTKDTFSDLSLNLIAVVSIDGSIAYAQFFDLQSGNFVDFPSAMRRYLTPKSILLDHQSTTSEVKGLLPLNNQVLLIASRPILTSSDEGPIRGAVIFGRLLDAQHAASLAAQTQTNFQFISLEKTKSDPELGAILAQLERDESSSSADKFESTPSHVVITQQAFKGYLLLRDIFHNPILLVAISRSRPIYQAALRSI